MLEFVDSGLYFVQDKNNFINSLLQVGSGVQQKYVVWKLSETPHVQSRVEDPDPAGQKPPDPADPHPWYFA